MLACKVTFLRQISRTRGGKSSALRSKQCQIDQRDIRLSICIDVDLTQILNIASGRLFGRLTVVRSIHRQLEKEGGSETATGRSHTHATLSGKSTQLTSEHCFEVYVNHLVHLHYVSGDPEP